MKAALLLEARRRYLNGGKTRLDWVHYLSEVARINSEY